MGYKMLASDEARHIIVYGEGSAFEVGTFKNGDIVNVYYRTYEGKEYEIAECITHDPDTGEESIWYFDRKQKLPAKKGDG